MTHTNSEDHIMLGADPVGSGTQSDPYQITMLAGDTFSYTVATNIPANFSVTSGNLSNIGLSLSGSIISGTAICGSTTVCITATATAGPLQTATQWITFDVYNLLTVSGNPAASWAGTAYSSTITISDVDPDVENETTLTLNEAATIAGFTLTKESETEWTLSRTADRNTAGTVAIEINASTSAGGISQSKTISSSIITYSDVGFTSNPPSTQADGKTVWLVKGDEPYTYTPTVSPEGATINASGTDSNITFANGVLTVTTSEVFNEKTVTLTVTSNAGGSEKTATQTINIQVWDPLIINTVPSVSNITYTIDGRTYSASVVADNYTSISWNMGDGTEYTGDNPAIMYGEDGNVSVSHKYATEGMYLVTVTVTDDRGQTARTTSVAYIVSDVADPETPVTPSDKTTIYLGAIIAGVIAIICLALNFLFVRNWILMLPMIVLLVVALLWQFDWIPQIHEWLVNLYGNTLEL